jgi:hypothetical protein
MQTSLKLIHWTPRIISILAICFIGMFATDAFNSTESFSNQLKDFFLHLIPTFILLGILVLAWAKELVGGIIFATLGLGLAPFIYQHNYTLNHSILTSLSVILVINGPFILTGFLFILSHFTKKKNTPTNSNKN